MPRFMVIVKANKDSENGVMPPEEDLAAMGRFNEELVKAGIMLDGAGLHPSKNGAKVRFKGSQRSVIDGPFTEAKEIIAGYWIWELKSLDEAIEWAKRIPGPSDPSNQDESDVEIRQLFGLEDFGDSAAAKKQFEELGPQIEANKAAKQ
jgi:hypothetical protein